MTYTFGLTKSVKDDAYMSAIKNFLADVRVMWTGLRATALSLASLLAVGVAVLIVVPASTANAEIQTCPTVIAAWAPADDVYAVSSMEQLYCLGTSDGASLLGESFKQAGNLSWSDISVEIDNGIGGTQLPTEWSVIGDDGQIFTGVYNGGGFSVTGLQLSDPTSAREAGMFKETQNATIKNLTLVDVEMASANKVGGLAATLGAGTTIDNVHVFGEITSGQGTDGTPALYTGGLAGSVEGSSDARPLITESSFDGTVTGVGSNVGGLIGFAKYVDLRDVSVGSISPTAVTILEGTTLENNPNALDRHSFGGGIAGILYEGNVINGASFTGDLSGKNMIGGIAGVLWVQAQSHEAHLLEQLRAKN